MLKLMIKKEFAELIAGLLRMNTNKKKISTGNIILFSVIFIFLFASLSFSMAGSAYMLCEPLCSANLTWLYFGMMGLLSLLFGTLGSAFSAYSTLYKSRDNEFLLSMPIPSKSILLSRLIVIYVMGFVFSALMIIPTFIVYFVVIGFNFLILLSSIVITFILPILSLVISCLLGWLIAWIFSYIKNNQMVIVGFSLLFLGLYFYIGTKFLSTDNIMNNINNLDIYMKKYLFLFYELGLGQSGEFLHLLVFVIIVFSLFLIEYYILSKSYIKLVTTNRGSKKVKYTSKKIKFSKPFNALVRKELKRFTSSSTYMLNCGIGLIMMVLAAVMLIINRQTIMTLIVNMGLDSNFIPALGFAVIGMLVSINYITAPSISLEGKNI